MIQLNGTMVLTELAAGVAFHGLSLAIAGKVVGSTALVAGGRAGVALEATAEATLETATASAASGGTSGGSSASAGGGGVGAVALREISLSAGIRRAELTAR